MEKLSTVALLDHLADVPDPRIARHRWHKLRDILVIAVCAVLCGAESYPAIEDFGHEREEWLKQFLELPEGIPSHDTFNRVLRLMDPVPFQACFLRWMQAVAEVTTGEIVAIDGKALRRSFAILFTAAIRSAICWIVKPSGKTILSGFGGGATAGAGGGDDSRSAPKASEPSTPITINAPSSPTSAIARRVRNCLRLGRGRPRTGGITCSPMPGTRRGGGRPRARLQAPRPRARRGRS